MKLEAVVRGEVRALEIVSPPPECIFRLNGDEFQVDVASPEAGVYSIVMAGRQYDVRIEEEPGGLVAFVNGWRFEIEIRDPRRFESRSGSRGKDGPLALTAPMPGKVVRVLVTAGDPVEAGQGIVVVEAMKMQNELKASRAGKVTSVAAIEGDSVSAGQLLATIE